MMRHEDPETWRADLEHGLPADVPLTFDVDRWTGDTVRRAEAALRRARRPRRWRYGVLTTAATAALVALSIVGHPAARRPPAPSAVPVWRGSGSLSQLDMVTPTVGWAMPWNPPGWVMYTSTGLSGFHVLARVLPRTRSSVMSWTPVGTTSLVVTVGVPGTGMVQVRRLRGDGRPAVRTDVSPPGAAGQFLEGWTSWASPQQGMLTITTNAVHGGRTWVYRTTSGGRRWQALPLPASPLPHLKVAGILAGRVLLVESRGRMYRSGDFGQAFTRVAVPPPPGWTGGWSLSAALLHPLGTGGAGVLLVPAHGNAYLYTTSDTGKHWQFSATMPRASSPEISRWGSHHLWVYSLTTGAIWASRNGGTTWRSLGVSTAVRSLLAGRQWLLSGMDFVSANTGYVMFQRREVVGHEPATSFYETVDGGAQWFPVPRFDGAASPANP